MGRCFSEMEFSNSVPLIAHNDKTTIVLFTRLLLKHFLIQFRFYIPFDTQPGCSSQPLSLLGLRKSKSTPGKKHKQYNKPRLMQKQISNHWISYDYSCFTSLAGGCCFSHIVACANTLALLGYCSQFRVYGDDAFYSTHWRPKWTCILAMSWNILRNCFIVLLLFIAPLAWNPIMRTVAVSMY